MYFFERAAELKAKTERVSRLTSAYAGRTVYWCATTSYEIVVDWMKNAMAQTQEQQHTLQRKGRFRPRDQSGTDLSKQTSQQDFQNFSSSLSASSATTKSAASTTTSAASMPAKIPTSAEELSQDAQLQEQFRLFQLMLLQQAQSQQQQPTATTPVSATPAFALPQAAAVAAPIQQQQQQQQARPAGVIPPPPYLPGFIGPDGNIVEKAAEAPKATYASQQAPKLPAAKPPAPKGPGGLDFSELKTRQLRKVGDPKDQPPQPPKPATTAGPFDLNELKNRPLRKVNRDENNNSNNNSGNNDFKPIPLPELRKVGLPGQNNNNNAPAPPPKPQLIVQGKTVVSSNIPGEEQMSFSERIKVASKMSLKSTAGNRSPGGTPRRDKNLSEETPFYLALRDKFKNCRPSLDNANDDTDGGEEWK